MARSKLYHLNLHCLHRCLLGSAKPHSCSPRLIIMMLWLICSRTEILHTVDSRYLEFQMTLWNTSRYPYLDISDLQNWEKINRTTTFHKYICKLTPEVRDILKILWNRGEIAPLENIVEKRRNWSKGAISPLFHNILLPVGRFSCLNRDQNFTSR